MPRYITRAMTLEERRQRIAARVRADKKAYKAGRNRPRWADMQKLAEVYARCPAGMVVDHIVPLRGKGVSGLHVPWNLQYLTWEENGRKGNSWPWPPHTEQEN